MISLKDIINGVRQALDDKYETETAAFYRWSDLELVGYVNNSLELLLTLRPDIRVTETGEYIYTASFDLNNDPLLEQTLPFNKKFEQCLMHGAVARAYLRDAADTVDHNRASSHFTLERNYAGL